MAARREDGFSLLEVLIAVAILGFVALAIVGLFLHSVETNASGFDYSLISSEARRALETLQGLPYNDAALNATASPVDIAATVAGWGSRRDYRVRYTVTEYDLQTIAQVQGTWTPVTGGATSNVKRITLTAEVAYSDADPLFTGGRVGNRRVTVTGLKIIG